MAQLPLKLVGADYARFETFAPGDNAAVVEHLRAVAAGAADTLWLWGAAGCGKTHLLQAACHAAAAAGRRAMYVTLDSADPAILVGLESVDLLALDNVERVARDVTWERALFVILNELLPRGGLVLAAAVSAAGCGFGLPDLASRAGGAVSYRLKSLADADRAVALRLHAAARGLELEPAAADYLLKRVARDMAALAAWLDRLDRDSLIEQRRLTIPFIRERLANGPASGE